MNFIRKSFYISNVWPTSNKSDVKLFLFFMLFTVVLYSLAIEYSVSPGFTI